MNNKQYRLTLLALLLFTQLCNSQSSINLAGEWKFRLDPDDVGKAEQWYQEELPDTIRIPGILQEQGYGPKPSINTPWIVKEFVAARLENYPSWYDHPMFERYRQEENFTFPYWLQPPRHYLGVGWYQTTVQVPESWTRQSVVLTLERCRWLTDVWINDTNVGQQDSLGTPHRYDLSSKLVTGKNRITVRIDGRMIIDLGYHAHSISDQTQTTWNGILGKVELSSKPTAVLQDVQAYPNAKEKRVTFKIDLSKELKGKRILIEIEGRSENSNTLHRVLPKRFEISPGGNEVTLSYPMGDDVLLWDEFHPNLYRMQVRALDQKSGSVLDEQVFRIGIRDIEAREGYFWINGRKTYLRGTLNCAEFPLHGYPEMDTESWKRIFSACKDYGLNHVRFHSWCPPEAAFEAADELGIYLQPEASEWTYVQTEEQMNFILRESARMFREYGNHPSFLLMASGNEAGFIPEYRNKPIRAWKQDNRRLYTHKANADASFTEEYDFQIGRGNDKGRLRIQLGWPPRPEGSTIVTEQPATIRNYNRHSRQLDHPIIAHETVQRCAYPNIADIKKFTGPMSPGYLKIARDQLEARGMLEQVQDFVHASGRWQLEQFKEEIEGHLRTDPMAGFQLLSLQDFPGQGTALVGVLDLFWESKGYTNGEEFRRFCSDTVPLALLPKRIFENEETIEGDIQVSYFGPQDKPEVDVEVMLQSDAGQLVSATHFPAKQLIRGLNSIGKVAFKLNPAIEARRLELIVRCHGQLEAENSWSLWQFPTKRYEENQRQVTIVKELDQDALNQLKRGGTFLWMPDPESIRGDIPQPFSSMYWNAPWTDGGESHTLGILNDPDHPVFKHFPTQGHSNWHWWSILTKARPMILDEWNMGNPWPKDYRPLIQPIDGWNLNRKLALLIEVRIGSGKLMICSMNLSSDLANRPAAQSLLYSILEYMNSPQFSPDTEIDPNQLYALLK